MSGFTLFWTLLFTIHSLIAPVELKLGRTPSGRVLAASIHVVAAGVYGLSAYLEQADGSFEREPIADGQLSFVTNPVILAGFAYLAVVCNLAVCIYRRDLSNPSAVWEGTPVAGFNNVVAVTLALTAGGLLALTVQTLANEWFFYTAAHPVTLAALAFVFVQAFSTIINPVFGGEVARQAQGPDGESCHLARLALGLTALCFIGGIWQTIGLEAMAAPTPGDLDIEASALYHAGFYYFMYVLAGGLVRLARINEVTLAVTLLTLGALTILPGIVPGVAMQVLGDHLVAGWVGTAVAVSLLAFTLVALSGFPLTASGPVAMLALGTALWACGFGSIECTIGAPPVPTAGAAPLAALLAALLAAGLLALAGGPALAMRASRRRRGGEADP